MTINTIEAGQSEPRAGTVRDLARGLGVEPGDLMQPDAALDALAGKPSPREAVYQTRRGPSARTAWRRQLGADVPGVTLA